MENSFSVDKHKVDAKILEIFSKLIILRKNLGDYIKELDDNAAQEMLKNVDDIEAIWESLRVTMSIVVRQANGQEMVEGIETDNGVDLGE